jgi:class 3 adenylate cyclase
MPLYIDRHDAHGISPEEVAQAHLLDAEVQDRYGVRYHTYWFDAANGSVFCLAEGPSREAVENVHRDAHGRVAEKIVELDPYAPLNAFLGSPPEHALGAPYIAPAMRAILFTDLCGSVAQTQLLGDDRHLELLREHNAIVRDQLEQRGGREVKHTGDGIMASFTSVVAAVSHAIGVQRAMRARNASADIELHIRIGITVGEPVTDDSDDLFGATVQLAARLCNVAAPAEIAVSLGVREMCVGKQFRFDARGDEPLKGLDEPTPVFSVFWTDDA